MKLLTKKLTRAEALQYVARKIVAHPEEYYQGAFCGSFCCIAGHLSILKTGNSVTRNKLGSVIAQRAEEMIAMNADDKNSLNLFGPRLYGRFYGQFTSVDEYSKTAEVQKARIGARAIKYYISKQDPKVMAQKIVCKGYDPAFGEPNVAK